MKSFNLPKHIYFVAGIFIFLFFVFSPSFVNAATLYFSPSSGNFSIGDILSINVLINTEGQAINQAEAVINFPTDLLEIISVNKSGSIFTLWVEEPSYSNKDGTISFNGGVPTPGFNGTAGKIINIVFRIRKAGIATVTFSSAAVRANDGYGTNIFKIGAPAQFNLVAIEKLTPVPEKPVPENLVPRREVPTAIYLPTPKITSPTHPDQEKWYNNNDPVFEWKVPEEIIEVRVLYGKNPDAIPTVRYSPPISKRSLTDIPDGTYWFSVQFIGEGIESNVGRFKFNIDTQPPILEEFSLGLIDTNSIKFKIKTKDELSGIEKIDVYLDNNLISSTSTDIFENVIKNVEPGRHIFKGVIYDKAGNLTQKEEIVNVPQPTIKTEIVIQKDYTLYFILLFVLILLIIMILIIYITKHRVEIIHKEIRKEKIENIKTDLKKHLKETLQDLRRDISLLDENPELSQQERELYQEARNILEESKKKIEEKLKELE